MRYLTHNNTPIYIAHFPGQTRHIYKDIVNETKETLFNKPDNIGIVTVATADTINSSPLIYQLDKNGYKYYNGVKGNISWHPIKKINYLLKGLKECKEEYVLVLDAADVTILNNLDRLVELLNSYNKKIIYNATIWNFPQDAIVDWVENRGQYGDYCWLNAGCCFGKTEDLIKFYEEVWEDVRTIAHPVSSEQYYIRKHFDNKQNYIFFDWDCRIFQCFHKQEIEDVEIEHLDGTKEIQRKLLY